MEEKRAPQMQKAWTSSHTRQSPPSGPASGEGLSPQALILSPSFSPESLSNRTAGAGGGLGRLGAGVRGEGVREEEAAGSSSVPALPPPPPPPNPCAHLLGGCLGMPCDCSPCALRRGRCLPRGAPGSRWGQVHGVKEPPHSAVLLADCLFPPGSGWPCWGGGTVRVLWLVL